MDARELARWKLGGKAVGIMGETCIHKHSIFICTHNVDSMTNAKSWPYYQRFADRLPLLRSQSKG